MGLFSNWKDKRREKRCSPEYLLVLAFRKELDCLLAQDRYLARRDYKPLIAAYAPIYAFFGNLMSSGMLSKYCRKGCAEEADVNATMAGYNTKIYADRKTSPELDIKSINRYTFSTPKDGGTGTQYKGLIVFDMAMLALTPLPVIVHDSVILKPIENEAIENIFKIYNSTPKQVFIAIDRASAYTQEAQNILESSQVLRLSTGAGALYGRVWNVK